ncbi:hypothetical protein [Algibacter sp. 2305UL17-15]|uniref:hypothetical protein n=1 Tax=Algibacter sp. 2305UL17-15 TaxID=3231268 RepID=UPI003458F418
MRFLITCFIVIVFAASGNAQIDSKKNSGIIIPAIEAPKDSLDNKKIVPEEPKENNQFDGVSAPKVVGRLEFPKKEFSMFPQEEFKNPGELYTKKLDKLEKELLPEGHGLNAGIKEDAYWGDYRTTSKSVTILVRDHSAIDGDLLRILVNDDIIQSNIYLTQNYKGLKLDLIDGINKIDFFAINTGSSGPNTAEYKIVDENVKLISRKVWALAKGVRVTFIVIKE